MQTAPLPETPSPATPHFAVGQKLAGCYTLRQRMEHASALAIWLADDEVLGKSVSLHFLPEGLRKNEAALDSVRAEVKRNRQVAHPNILRVYDFVEEVEWAAIVMETLEGESLAALRGKRAAGFFEKADVKPWLAQLSQTLEDAHKIQLCHRDVALENIFLEKSGRLVLASFGISRCVRAAADGALANLSPQQVEGQRATAADDIYAMGVLVHELLAGQPPFSGGEVREKILHAPAPSMMERRFQSGKGGGPIPPGWEKVVAACLEKNPDQRPKTMSDFAARLGLDKVSVAAAPTPSPELELAAESAPAIIKEPTLVKPAPIEPAAVVKSEPSPVAVNPARKEAARWVPAESRAPKMTREFEEDLEVDPSEENAIPDHYPTLRARRSGFPVTGLAAGLLLVALSLYAVWPGLFTSKDKTPTDHAFGTAERTDGSELTPVTNPILPTATPQDLPAAKPVVEEAPTLNVSAPAPPSPVAKELVAKREPIIEEAPPVVAAIGEKPQIDSAILLAAKKATPVKAATPIPTPSGALPMTADSLLAAKTAELEAAKRAAETAEKAHQDLLKQKSQAEANVVAATATLEEKTKAAAPVLKAAEEIGALKQQREEAARAAELAAQEAQKAAMEKARQAEEAKKSAASVESDSRDKLAAQVKMEKELSELKRTIAQKEKQIAEMGRLADEARAKRESGLATVRQTEQAVASAKVAADEAAKKAVEEAARMELVRKGEGERRAMIKKEMDDARKAFDDRMKALEDALRVPIGNPPAPAATVPAPKPAATLPPVAPIPSASLPATTPAPPIEMAKVEPPKPAPVLIPEEKPAPAVAGADGLTNSLGMKFARVGEVDFAIWETRVKDFEAFANATGLKSNLWRDPGFKQAPEHPVVNVTWQEAMAFCKWLTFKEQREGVLQASQSYRLPTDLEWSKAVGLPEETGKTPEARDMGVPDVYPWGTQWPPPAKAGNYTGEETGSDVAIKGYEDGFPWTAPVGSFPPNKYGLYDMGGNVWQWVMDSWSGDAKSKVLRGASWYNGALKLSLLSSCRVHAAQDSGTDNYGFRCVIATEQGRAAKR